MSHVPSTRDPRFDEVLSHLRQRDRTRRKAKQVADVSRERAAEVVLQLAAFDQGVPTKSLLKHEVPGQLTRALCLLVIHEWIGVSQDGHRVWLSTDAQKRLS
jgi:hypothetical protein